MKNNNCFDFKDTGSELVFWNGSCTKLGYQNWYQEVNNGFGTWLTLIAAEALFATSPSKHSSAYSQEQLLYSNAPNINVDRLLAVMCNQSESAVGRTLSSSAVCWQQTERWLYQSSKYILTSMFICKVVVLFYEADIVFSSKKFY